MWACHKCPLRMQPVPDLSSVYNPCKQLSLHACLHVFCGRLKYLTMQGGEIQSHAQDGPEGQEPPDVDLLSLDDHHEPVPVRAE